jgi:hypothetical protein
VQVSPETLPGSIYVLVSDSSTVTVEQSTFFVVLSLLLVAVLVLGF